MVRWLFATRSDWAWLLFLVCLVAGIVLFVFGLLALASHRAYRFHARGEGSAVEMSGRWRRTGPLVPPGSADRVPDHPPRLASVSLVVGTLLSLLGFAGTVVALQGGE